MDELLKIMNLREGTQVIHALEILNFVGIMEIILPEVTALIGIEQPKKEYIRP